MGQWGSGGQCGAMWGNVGQCGAMLGNVGRYLNNAGVLSKDSPEEPAFSPQYNEISPAKRLPQETRSMLKNPRWTRLNEAKERHKQWLPCCGLTGYLPSLCTLREDRRLFAVRAVAIFDKLVVLFDKLGHCGCTCAGNTHRCSFDSLHALVVLIGVPAHHQINHRA